MTRRHALLGGAVIFSLAFLLLAWIAHDPSLAGADRGVQALVQSQRSAMLERPMQIVTRVGAGYVSIPLSILIVVLLARRHRYLAMFFAAVSAGGHLLSPVAKWLVARPRPKLSPYGFPSGHTIASVVVFGALMYAAAVLIRRPAPRWLAIAACGAVIVVVSYSRLYLNSHWATDVAGGLTGGAAIVLLGIAWKEKRAAVSAASRAATS